MTRTEPRKYPPNVRGIEQTLVIPSRSQHGLILYGSPPPARALAVRRGCGVPMLRRLNPVRVAGD
jgi:hypothetical protein